MWDPSSNLGLEILISQFAKKKVFVAPIGVGPLPWRKIQEWGPTEKIPYGPWVGFEQFLIVPFPWPWGGVSCDNEHHPMVCSEETWHLGFLKSSQLSVEQRSFGNHEITHTCVNMKESASRGHPSGPGWGALMQQILGNLHLVSIIAISIAMSGNSKKPGESFWDFGCM